MKFDAILERIVYCQHIFRIAVVVCPVRVGDDHSWYRGKPRQDRVSRRIKKASLRGTLALAEFKQFLMHISKRVTLGTGTGTGIRIALRKVRVENPGFFRRHPERGTHFTDQLREGRLGALRSHVLL